MYTQKFYSTEHVPCTFICLMESRISMQFCIRRLFLSPDNLWFALCRFMWYVVHVHRKKGSVLVSPWNDLMQVSAHSVPVYFLPSSFSLFSTHFLPTPVPCPPLPFLLATNMRISGSSSLHFHRHCFSITTPFCTANVPDAAAVGFRNSALSQNRPIWGNWECASICVCWFRGNI